MGPFEFGIVVGIIIIFVYLLLPKEDKKSYGSMDPYGRELHGKEKDPYQLLLEDRRWKARREEILERDGHKCTWCGRTDHLQVHHKCYYRYPDGRMAEPWDYPDSKLITLCDDCHKKYHEKYHVGTYYRKRGEHYR